MQRANLCMFVVNHRSVVKYEANNVHDKHDKRGCLIRVLKRILITNISFIDNLYSFYQ